MHLDRDRIDYRTFTTPPSTFEVEQLASGPEVGTDPADQPKVGPTVFFVNGYPPQNRFIDSIVRFGSDLGGSLHPNLSGSISVRHGNGFLITADKTPLDRITRLDIIEVVDYDPVWNTILCIGKRTPSPEAVIHWFAYRGFGTDHAVVIVHTPDEDASAIPFTVPHELPISPHTYEHLQPDLALKSLYLLRESPTALLKDRGLIVHGDTLEFCHQQLQAQWAEARDQTYPAPSDERPAPNRF